MRGSGDQAVLTGAVDSAELVSMGPWSRASANSHAVSFRHANLRRARLDAVQFEQRADFTGAQMDGADLRKSYFGIQKGAGGIY